MKNQNLITISEKLRERYPDYVSLEQFRIICRTAKRTASYLLTSGIVPAIDTGKKTCRWRINVEDVIAYLSKVDKIDEVTVSSVINHKTVYPKVLRKTFTDRIKTIPAETQIEFLEQKYYDYPDAMTTTEMANIATLEPTTIMKYVKSGKITALRTCSMQLIPKLYAFQFMVSQLFIERVCSIKYVVAFHDELNLWLDMNASDCEVVS